MIVLSAWEHQPREAGAGIGPEGRSVLKTPSGNQAGRGGPRKGGRNRGAAPGESGIVGRNASAAISNSATASNSGSTAATIGAISPA